MKNKLFLMVCATLLSSIGVSYTTYAEETNAIESSSESVSSNDQADEHIQAKTAIVNGEEVTLEAPEKSGKSEADATQAPKEELQQGQVSRSARSVVRTIPMYRMYNPNSGEHFYTQDTGERDNLRRIGWNYEGIGWQAPTSGDPVYRLYNKRVNWHHYTLDEHEKNVISKQGWNYEGVGWYAVGNGQPSNDDYKLLGVKNYNQYALGAPSGCEGASLLQALQYKGKITNWSLTQFLNTIPKSPNGNPNNGFVGSPFVENSWTYSAIYPAPKTGASIILCK